MCSPAQPCAPALDGWPAVINDARRVLADGLKTRVFPAAAVDVGSAECVLWQEAAGTLTFEESTATELTPRFDLASLPKPIATTTAVMQLVAEAALRLDQPLTTLFDEWRGSDREAVTIADLLEHA